MDLANIVGNASSSYIFQGIGYTGVFGIVVACCVASVIYIICFLPESLEKSEKVSYSFYCVK